MKSNKLQTIIDALEPTAIANGFDLIDVELAGSGHHQVVRVFLDKPDGLTLDNVAEANSWVNAAIDELDPFKGSYTLEVSSPGIDRPLRTLRHFAQAAGQTAVIILDSEQSSATPAKPSKSGAKPRSKFTGRIFGVQPDPDSVLIEVDGVVEKLDFLSIKKAHIKGQVSFKDRKDA
ncbi:ribosome maturation factor RimP [Actinomycetota bacterium]|nr:ribosome maturation factor RimP [Actinomycetota bacterium]